MNILDELKSKLGDLSSIKVGLDEYGNASIEAMVMVEPTVVDDGEMIVIGTSYCIEVGIDCELGVDNVDENDNILDPWEYLTHGLNDELNDLKGSSGNFIIGDR